MISAICVASLVSTFRATFVFLASNDLTSFCLRATKTEVIRDLSLVIDCFSAKVRSKADWFKSPVTDIFSTFDFVVYCIVFPNRGFIVGYGENAGGAVGAIT